MNTILIGASLLLTASTSTTARMGDLDKAADVKVMRVFDGKLYVAGFFERANRKLANNIAIFDGTSWSTIGRGVDGKVKDIAMLKGALFVAGDFTYVGKSFESEGIIANRIAKWDGKAWSAMGKFTVDRDINSLTTDGKNLYSGGNFTKINDETETRGVAMWNGTKFVAMNGKFDRAVMSMAMVQGKLYAGGIFKSNGDDECNSIASYNGKDWEEVGGGLTGSVSSLSSDDKNLYVAGAAVVGGKAGIQMWDGSKWSNLVDTDGSSTKWVHAEAGKLYFAGDLTKINGKATYKIGIYDVATKKVTTLDEVIYAQHKCIVPFGNNVILGGNYNDVPIDAPGFGGLLKWNGTDTKIGSLDVVMP